MSFLLDDAAFGGQVMIGAGQPIALGLGVGENKKIRGSAFIEGPAQIGRSGAFPERLGTLMIAKTANVDCESPEKSLYVLGDVVIDGREEGSAESKARTLLVQGTVKIEGFPEYVALLVEGPQEIAKGGLEVEGNISAGGRVTSNGGAHVLSAKKNFDIPHPTKEGWRLRHTCPEGPSNDVYVRGRVKNKTEIENLYLCGASTLSHGVTGATYSGLAAAAQILNCTSDDLLIKDDSQKIKIYDAEDSSTWSEFVHKKREDKIRNFKEINLS